MIKILLIDDMAGVRSALRVVLETAGHSVTEAVDGADGLEKAMAGSFDLVITDMMMPNIDGVEVISALKASRPDLAVLAISGGDQSVSANQTLMLVQEMGYPVLPKPFSRNDILAHVERMTRPHAAL